MGLGLGWVGDGLGSLCGATLCAKRGGVKKMLQSPKSNTYILFIRLSYEMFNLEGHHLPYFMAILWHFSAKYGHIWP